MFFYVRGWVQSCFLEDVIYTVCCDTRPHGRENCLPSHKKTTCFNMLQACKWFSENINFLRVCGYGEKWLRIQWYLIAMCFDLGVIRGGSFEARILAAWLSSHTIETLERLSRLSSKVRLSALWICPRGMSANIKVKSAIYSASSVDSTILVWTFEDQPTGLLLIVITYLVRDLLNSHMFCSWLQLWKFGKFDRTCIVINSTPLSGSSSIKFIKKWLLLPLYLVPYIRPPL